MPQEIPREALGVRRHVKQLVRRDARVRAAGDVADRVAARLTRRHPDGLEHPHGGLDVVQLHEVKLDVLAGRDVAEPTRVFLADVRHRVPLRRRDQPLRQLHAQHLRVLGLTLSVGAPHETEGAPLIGRDFAAFVLREHAHELVDIGLFGEAQPRAAVGGLFVDD